MMDREFLYIVLFGVMAIAVILALVVRQPAEPKKNKSSRKALESGDAESQIRSLLDQNRKIEAIKLLRELHPSLGLKGAKDAVEAIGRGKKLPPEIAKTPVTIPADEDIDTLVRNGQMIEAIKMLRQRSPELSLHDAKTYVDDLARRLRDANH